MKNKFIASLLLIIFASVYTNVAKAEEQPSDYERLLTGECVTTDGFFFSDAGMANLYVAVDEKIKLAVLDKQKEISKLKLDLSKCSDLKAVELRIQKEMFEEQLLIKQRAIDAYKSDIFWGNLRTVGYVILGVGIGIAAGYIISK
jgi:hypothetical protein